MFVLMETLSYRMWVLGGIVQGCISTGNNDLNIQSVRNTTVCLSFESEANTISVM